MKRKERNRMNGIDRAVWYMKRKAPLFGHPDKEIRDWLTSFWLELGCPTTDRIRRICKSDTAWIGDKIKNYVDPQIAAEEYKRTHI